MINILNYNKLDDTEIKLEGCTINLNKEQHRLLYEVMIEYRKNLNSKLIANKDRYAAIYLRQAYLDLIQLCKTLNVYEKWMDKFYANK